MDVEINKYAGQERPALKDNLVYKANSGDVYRSCTGNRSRFFE